MPSLPEYITEDCLLEHLSTTITTMMISQEARIFNESPINVLKCHQVLTSILKTLRSGNSVPDGEATDLFFAVSKLFQHRDPSLRQIVHLLVRELARITDDVIMITSSVMKDTVGGSDLIFRPNAIRNLCRVIDISTVQAVERSLRTAINDKAQAVSAAGLVTSYHLFLPAPEAVRRFSSETQDALANHAGGTGVNIFAGGNLSTMPQYHAMGLLLAMRKYDKNSLIKILQTYQKPSLARNNLALVLLIRLAGCLVDCDPSLRGSCVAFLHSWADHKSEMISLESLKTLANMKHLRIEEAEAIVKGLSTFLLSARSMVKIMALKILKVLSVEFPVIVSAYNKELENCISIGNKVISTVAIAILLQTGNEESVEKLVNQVKLLIPDISDEFRIFIVGAVEQLARKFTKQISCIISLLSSILREEGSCAFKERVIRSFGTLISHSPNSREEILLHLCEFVEDCEYPKLAILVLGILAKECQATKRTGPFIRYIYNRIVLENSNVRAASVGALSTILNCGQEKDPLFQRSIGQLLQSSLDDNDDEVRDRATTGMELASPLRFNSINPREDAMMESCESYLLTRVDGEREIDLLSMQLTSGEPENASDQPLQAAKLEGNSRASVDVVLYKQLCQLAPVVGQFGVPFRISKAEQLTEAEAEYSVQARKFVFANHIVIQFSISNTLTDVWLRDTKVLCNPVLNDPSGSAVECWATTLPSLGPGQTSEVVVAFTLETSSQECSYPIGRFMSTLRFCSVESEGASESFADEFQIEGLNVTLADYMSPGLVEYDFWGSESNFLESSKRFKSSKFRSLSDCVAFVGEHFQFKGVEGSGFQTFNMEINGTLPNKMFVGMKVQMASLAVGVIAFKTTARSRHSEANEFIIRAFTHMVKR